MPKTVEATTQQDRLSRKIVNSHLYVKGKNLWLTSDIFTLGSVKNMVSTRMTVDPIADMTQ
ncbi:hypothetical protein I79_000377 [Cricetulus griseus]|uniref:Uncharacterized protein n=1 Tax=Cricetulus griseus TaxID=10029 RepID=G3GS64_CRIGR|nr:hypothetical protein I79_000377 [Cricetulus griseus]